MIHFKDYDPDIYGYEYNKYNVIVFPEYINEDILYTQYIVTIKSMFEKWFFQNVFCIKSICSKCYLYRFNIFFNNTGHYCGGIGCYKNFERYKYHHADYSFFNTNNCNRIIVNKEYKFFNFMTNVVYDKTKDILSFVHIPFNIIPSFIFFWMLKNEELKHIDVSGNICYSTKNYLPKKIRVALYLAEHCINIIPKTKNKNTCNKNIYSRSLMINIHTFINNKMINKVKPFTVDDIISMLYIRVIYNESKSNTMLFIDVINEYLINLSIYKNLIPKYLLDDYHIIDINYNNIVMEELDIEKIYNSIIYNLYFNLYKLHITNTLNIYFKNMFNERLNEIVNYATFTI